MDLPVHFARTKIQRAPSDRELVETAPFFGQRCRFRQRSDGAGPAGMDPDFAFERRTAGAVDR